MKTTARIAIFTMALALPGSPAWAQGADPQAAAAKTAEAIRAATLQQETAMAAFAADQAAAAEDRKQAEKEAARAKDERAKAAAREREMALYEQGKAALDQARYALAQKAFAEAVALQGSRLDGALYWRAFSEYKLAEMQAALGTLRELQKASPDSRWMKEARALELEVKGASGSPVSPGAAQDDELKLLALNGLLQSDSEQALPMLEKMINSQQSPQLKKRALFVLSQSKSPKAREILTAIAKGTSNPDLQLEALQYLGMFGGPQNKQVLAEIYAASKDPDVKRRILQGYMVSRQRDALLAAAKGEADASLRKDAVRMLGTMHAAADLQKLYQGESSPEIKQSILEAYMVGGESDLLLQVARSDADPALRLQAVRMLGVIKSSTTGDALADLYGAAGQSKEVRAEVVNALFIQGNAKALVDIARKETDPALRKALVERLSMMKSKEATDFLMELINK
jgi:hypothetical protein